jgi:hypothetical protein
MKLRSLLMFPVLFLCSCSAMQTAAEFSELQVKATTERPSFVRQRAENLFLIVDCPVIEFATLRDDLVRAYSGKGYSAC